MTLAVVNIRGTQVRARDADRRSDVESMARQLDSLYKRGYTFTYGGSPKSFRGKFPTTAQMNDTTARTAIFADFPAATLIDPIKQTSAQSIFPATNSKEGTDPDNSPATAVQPTPGTVKPYIYQPFDENGILCTQDDTATPQTCRRFNIYYRTEFDGNIQVIRSNYQ